MPTPGPRRDDRSDKGSHHRARSHDGEHSSNDEHPNSPCSTTSGESYEEEHDRQQQQQRDTKRQTSKASSKARSSKTNSRNARVNGPRRSQLPLREVVACRAFECIIGAHGKLSKVFDIDPARKKRPEIDGDHSHQAGRVAAVGESNSEQREHQHHHRRHRRQSHNRRPPISDRRVEPVPYGEDIDVGDQVVQFFTCTAFKTSMPI